MKLEFIYSVSEDRSYVRALGDWYRVPTKMFAFLVAILPHIIFYA